MDSLIRALSYNLKRNLLFPRFLKSHQLDPEIVKRHLHDSAIQRKAASLVKENHFKTKDVYHTFEPLFLELGVVDSTAFLKDAYAYAININFPGTEPMPEDDAFKKAAAILLKLVSVFSDYQRQSQDGTWQSKYPILLLTPEEEDALEPNSHHEFMVFKRAYHTDHVYELMKLSQDVKGYSTLDHICGVQHLAMKIARQLKVRGTPIDMARICGAAVGHDVGKYGCLPHERHRVAYFHYYYTGEWFKARDIVYIRNIAINHSTWDLELDNLPLEALLLIYCDFRVKENEHRHMHFYTLKDSFDVILDKLDNVDEAKEKRYRKVYARLKDFEDYMHELGITTDPDAPASNEVPTRRNKHYFSLLQGDDIIEQTKFVSIRHNIHLMHLLRDEASLGKMLESARDVGNLIGLRGYLNILEEYSVYLTPKQKQITMNFLYDRLISPEEDIRKLCAQMIGHIIGKYDEELRKELPEGVNLTEPEYTGLKLFEIFTDKFLNPDQKIIQRHKLWIRRAYSGFVDGYFKSQTNPQKRHKAAEFITDLYVSERDNPIYERELLDSAMVEGYPTMAREHQERVLAFMRHKVMSGNLNCRLHTIDVLNKMVKRFGRDVLVSHGWSEFLHERLAVAEHTYEAFSIAKVIEKIDCEMVPSDEIMTALKSLPAISDLYLSNLKAATPDIVKKVQIQFLLRYVTHVAPHDRFYTAMHFCNLLKVSSTEAVRNSAGEGLIRMLPHMTFEQCNDIVIELLRALEMESFQVTRYIPDYLGRLILYLRPEELDETIEDFKEKVKKANAQTVILLLKTVGIAIKNYHDVQTEESQSQRGQDRYKTLLGILLNGFVSYIPGVTQMAFYVIGKDLFSCTEMPLEKRHEIYGLIGKKLLALSATTNEEDELIFLHNAAGFKNIYAFIADYQSDVGILELKKPENIAFFPGTFDPFSLSHKEIAREIRDLGFEVYLYVDEFSWSKRTHPNLIRRNIIKMSVADELGIYTFPRNQIVNISNEGDLLKLKEIFPDNEVFLVVGSDVVVNASAYRKNAPSVIHSFPHIVFERKFETNVDVSAERLNAEMRKLDPRTVRLYLKPQFEAISSTQIRNYVDQNRDISELVDPLAQRYIYTKGLYQREPQFKEKLTINLVNVEMHEELSEALIDEAAASIADIGYEEARVKLTQAAERLNFRMLVIRGVKDGRIIGFSAFHWLRASNIYHEFSDPYLENYLRENSVGRIIVVDGIFGNKDTIFRNVEQTVLTETLAYAVARDYSYGIHKDCIRSKLPRHHGDVLKHAGFLSVKGTNGDEIHVVNMSTPCTINLDIRSSIKEPYRQSESLVNAISATRGSLQQAITQLYPGNLLLNFDRTMLYENLIKKICMENEVPTVNLEPRQVGPYMCVPFGAILKRWILPNTVTKSIHVEKYFKSDLSEYVIEAYPHYLDMSHQIQILKSFNRPIMLIDDILDKGYRIVELEPLLRSHDVEVRKMFVGILSGRGKALMEMRNMPVDAAYFIPRLKVWFNESKLYPFLGGDGVIKDGVPERNLLPSTNLILPYMYPAYIKGASPKSVYELSRVAIMNAIRILEVLEDEYQKANDRILTLANLGEVLMSPRYPDKGNVVKHDMGKKASDALKNDLEQLERLAHLFT